MKLYNKSKRMYQHGDYNLKPQEALEVDNKTAEILLKLPDIVEYVEPKDLKKVEEEARAKQEALVKENEKLKAEIEKLKAKQDGKK